MRILSVLLLMVLVGAFLAVPVLAAGTVDLFFLETDLREALLELSLEADVNILVGPEVHGVVTLDITDVTPEEALKLLLAGTPYQVVRGEDYYLVGDPSSEALLSGSQTRVFALNYASARSVAKELAAYPAAVSYHSGNNTLTVTAVPAVMNEIERIVSSIDTRRSPYLVAYRLEILELREERAMAVGLREVALESRDSANSALSLIYGPDMLALLSNSALAPLRLEAVQRDFGSARVSTPEVITAIDYPAELRVVEEKIRPLEGMTKLIAEASGLEFTLTPGHVNGDTAQVLTRIELASPEKAHFDTEVWLDADEAKLIAVIEQTTDESSRRTLHRRTGQERRYFAVYAKARTVSAEEMDDWSRSWGSFGHLGRLLWPDSQPVVAREENFVEAYISPGEDLRGTVAARIWLTNRLRAEGELSGGPEETLWLGLETPVFLEGVRLGMRYYYSDSLGGRAAVAFSDRVKLASGLVISAGFLPIVYGFEQQALLRPYWWGAVLIERGRVAVKAEVGQTDGESHWQAQAGYRLTDNLELAAYYRDQVGDKNGRFWLGVRVLF